MHGAAEVGAAVALGEEHRPVGAAVEIGSAQPIQQPVPEIGNRHRLLPFETPIPNVFLANTTQIYPEDRGTNYSVRLGREVATRIADLGSGR